MNPPYNGNLHLKILREAIKHIEKDGGEIVNLSPIRWLQDPLAEYKRGSDWLRFTEIRTHIKSLDIVSTMNARRMFDAEFLFPLGVYHITNEESDIYASHTEWFQKVIKQIKTENNASKYDFVKYNDDLDNYVCLNRMAPPMKYGKPMYDWAKRCGVCDKSHTYRKYKESCATSTRGNAENTLCVRFKTRKEATNFYSSLQTKFAHYLCKELTVDIHVHIDFLPFMPTYAHPWTNEQLYEYFGLNDEERKIIEEEMK